MWPPFSLTTYKEAPVVHRQTFMLLVQNGQRITGVRNDRQGTEDIALSVFYRLC